MTEKSHEDIFNKLVEHEDSIVSITEDVRGIKDTLTPIAAGVTSMAWVFRALLAIGAGSAAVVGIIKLWEQFQ